MKLSKKLLIVAILASLLAPVAMKDSKKPSFEMTVIANGSEAPVEYDDSEHPIKNPKAIQIVTTI